MKTKVNYSYLQKLNTILDCPCGCRSSIKDELFSIDVNPLKPYLKMTYHYMLGKYYCYQAKIKNELANLELANSQFDAIFMVARRLRDVTVNNPKHFFKAAHTKYELSKLMSDSNDARALKNKSKELVNTGLKIDSDNSSLLWLLSELKK